MLLFVVLASIYVNIYWLALARNKDLFQKQSKRPSSVIRLTTCLDRVQWLSDEHVSCPTCCACYQVDCGWNHLVVGTKSVAIGRVWWRRVCHENLPQRLQPQRVGLYGNVDGGFIQVLGHWSRKLRFETILRSLVVRTFFFCWLAICNAPNATNLVNVLDCTRNTVGDPSRLNNA